MKFDDKLFQKLALEFEKKGFNNSKHFKHNYCFEFYKTNQSANSINVIRVLYSYNKKQISDITSRISFNNVTRILEKFVDVGKDFYDQTAINFLRSTDSKSSIRLLREITLTNTDEFELLKGKIMEHVDAYIFPFFEEISNLQKLNDKISKVPQSEYSNYLYGESNFKALIIMKLCNNPQYDELKAWLIELYRKLVVTEPEKYVKKNEIALNLLAYLDGNKYKDLLKNNL